MSRRPLVLLSTMLVLSACSPSSTTPPSRGTPTTVPRLTREAPDLAIDPQVERAIERADAATSGRYRHTIELTTGGPEGDPIRSIVDGEFDERRQRYARQSGAGDVLGDAAAMRIVVDGAVAYLWRADGVGVVSPSGWIGAPAAGHDEALAEMRAMGFLPDLVAYVAILVGADRLRFETAEVLDGARVDRYRTTVLLDSVTDRLPPDRADAVGAVVDELTTLISQTGGSAAVSLPAVIWLDEAGALRRYQLDLPVDHDAFGPGATARVVFDLYDYGEPIDIAVPDPSEVGPIT